MLLNIEKGTNIKDIIFWEQDGGIFGRFKLIQFLPPTGFYSRNTYRDSRRKFPHFQFPPDTCNVAFNVSRVREMEIRGERRRERERVEYRIHRTRKEEVVGSWKDGAHFHFSPLFISS